MNALADTQEFSAEGPQPLLREIPIGKPYPVSALGALQAAVEGAHDITQAPMAIAAQSALSVASFVVQGFANVETLSGDTPVSLFCLTIAESGERKSSCDRLFMKGVRAFEQSGEVSFRVQIEDFNLQYEIWEAKKKRLKSVAAGADAAKATKAASALRELGPRPLAPLSSTIIVQEPTLEGLLKLYQVGRPSIGLFNDDSGSFFGGHAMNKDNRLKTISGLSQLWGGDPLSRTRSGDGASNYRGRRLAVHLMGQPVAVHPLLSDPQASGQGFLARFLVTQPESTIGTRLKRSANPSSEDALSIFAAKTESLLAAQLPTRDDRQELSPRILPLSPEAKDLLWTFQEQIELEQRAGGPLEFIRSVASKAAEQASRIAGVMTLWGDLNAVEVTSQAMVNAIELAKFYVNEAKRLADVGHVSAETSTAELLRKFLQAWPYDDIVPSEILHSGPNALRERKALDNPLSLLVRTGHLIRLPAGEKVRGKMRREAYRIVRTL